jgi:hypothetical protein
MTTVLLDTNIVSYLFKRDSRAAQYAPHLIDRELAIAMMTVAELLQWAAIRNWGGLACGGLNSSWRAIPFCRLISICVGSGPRYA